jgi:hypothetical protein
VTVAAILLDLTVVYVNGLGFGTWEIQGVSATLTRRIRNDILGLGRARNLVVHGDVDFVKESLVESVRAVRAEVADVGRLA